jgi:NAD-dependent deacetylase
MKKKLVVLSGAGMSKESGISTFRDMGGLWEQHDVMEVATFEAWQRNPEFVQRFYNDRRKQLLECEPNDGHRILAALESDFDVYIVTQNVDDLHERAGSTHVLHLHGELKKSRSTVDEHLVYPIDGWELKMGDLCEKGSQLRPHIVWFGEAVPLFTQAAELVQQADILLVVGTSLNVYPAAGLIHYSRSKVPVYLVDPEPAEVPKHVHIIAQPATIGLAQFAKTITSPAAK